MHHKTIAKSGAGGVKKDEDESDAEFSENEEDIKEELKNVEEKIKEDEDEFGKLDRLSSSSSEGEEDGFFCKFLKILNYMP